MNILGLVNNILYAIKILENSMKLYQTQELHQSTLFMNVNTFIGLAIQNINFQHQCQIIIIFRTRDHLI